ncbi:NAD(P)/FAD-dependent oxidoreductase [Nakamurella antarctica]|uniref:NAD(P)/FAD-dependent oxidoreductase n=1 Tax=Nakamurella antarctica TaxID=1902245 RepID=A0A3G8ZS05_9ACTN|nr:FAD-dependent oxidoreductase [Nakamurella antarctica]AZI57294.1 NAD(P)/FAD-dependent oxidoreductase [Nakamurella antarctica]
MTAKASAVIVGAALAGHATAKALRQQGFEGVIRIIGAETERPYDRPPLSKEYLAGTATEADLSLETAGETIDADWILGAEAIALDPATTTVSLASGDKVSGAAVFIATGSRARRMATELSGVHSLRTLSDARSLKAELQSGARLVVIGAGFIGAEVASTAKGLGLDVTVLEAAPAPLLRQLGIEVGAAVAGLHSRNGVNLLVGDPVVALKGTDRVHAVELASGRVLPADVVVAGIGADAETGWLVSSGLSVGNGVLCDAQGATSAPGVFAVGDCSAWFDATLGRAHRVEHWTDSQQRPALAVKGWLSGANPAEPATLKAPYFWSDQYGVTIQFAGHRLDTDELVIEDGELGSDNMLATWRREGRIVAVLGLNQPRAFTKHRKALQAVFSQPR